MGILGVTIGALALTGALAAASPPDDDYTLVAWCHGMVGGYLDLQAAALPEVERIEAAFRPPDRSLAEDMAVYVELADAAAKSRQTFEAALGAAEAAGLADPIGRGSATQRGRAYWTSAQQAGSRRLAQEWMSWSLPGRCEAAAARLAAIQAAPAAAAAPAQSPPAQAAVAAESVAPPGSQAQDRLTALETRCREGAAASCRLLARERARRR